MTLPWEIPILTFDWLSGEYTCQAGITCKRSSRPFSVDKTLKWNSRKMNNSDSLKRKREMVNSDCNQCSKQVKTLQQICRATVLSTVTMDRIQKVDSLGLPKLLKEYLSSFNIPDDFDLDGFYIDYHCSFPNHLHHKVHQIHPGKCLIDGEKVLIKSQHLSELCRTCETSGKCVMESKHERATWETLRHEHLMSCLMSIHDPLSQRVNLVFEFPCITLQDFVFRMFLAKTNVPDIISWQVLSKLAAVLIFLEDNEIIPWELCHPQNVVITNKGEVKLENLLLYLPTKSGSRYQTNTARRMSPEQIKGEPVTSKTLVWGLGRVLYEICARLPLNEPTLKTSNMPPMCYHQAVNCTKNLSKIMCECLRNCPSSRPTLQAIQERADKHIKLLAVNNYDTQMESKLMELIKSLDRLPFSGGFLR